jgi:hypothetical protein
MPKKPNYDFERRERDRLKAAKTAAKTAAKLEQRQRLRDAEALAGVSPPDED